VSVEITKPFFQLDSATQTQIVKFTNRVILNKGEMIDNDDLMKYFYIVVDGKVRNYQINLENAKEQTISILRAGDMFDTIIVLDNKEHDVMYEAIQKSELMKFPIEYIRQLLATNDSFRSVFFTYIAQQMRAMEELATDMALYSTSQRLIKLLLQNSDPTNKSKFNILQGLSNTQIANLIGTVRHVVERHLKALKSDGIIESKERNLKIKDTQRLLDKLDLL
jgi:CRP-like cAMP-binding protein